jgi:flagellar assembly factor FliW
MACVLTRDLGELEYAEESVIDFPHGVPAFEGERRFVLIQPPSLAPLVFLQSAATPALAFTAVPVTAIDAGYELSVLPEDFETLGRPESRELSVYALLTFPENGPVTANLLAPIVVNTAIRRAVQAVRCDSRYSHQHLLGDRTCL